MRCGGRHGRSPHEFSAYGRWVGGDPGVNSDGRPELLGLKVGNSETEAFWAKFISSRKAAGICEAVERGLAGVKLVISVGIAFPEEVPSPGYSGLFSASSKTVSDAVAPRGALSSMQPRSALGTIPPRGALCQLPHQAPYLGCGPLLQRPLDRCPGAGPYTPCPQQHTPVRFLQLRTEMRALPTHPSRFSGAACRDASAPS